MSTELATPATELEIVTDAQGITGDESLALTAHFAPFYAQAEEWRAKVATVTEPKVARASRLVLKGIRIEAKNTHEKLKERYLKTGRAIDGLFNVIKEHVEPLEKQLLEIETAAERAEEARKLKQKHDREVLLAPFKINTAFYNLAEMPADDFAQLLADQQAIADARAEAARKAEEKRIAEEKAAAEAKAAKEKADAEERERMRADNERLKKEQAAAIEAARKAGEKARKEREAAEAKLAEERRRAKEAADAAEAKARAEREAAEVIARKERAALEAKANAEREAREKLEREAKAAREKEAARHAAEAEEQRRAAAAPDREKLTAFAALVRTLEVPEMATPKGREIASDLRARVASFADVIDGRASTL
jgi:hypothetical protein